MRTLFVLIVTILQLLFAEKIPVIIDTDIGTDFDDCVAISYALSRNDVFDIKLILTATFNTTGRAQLVAKFLQATNRSDVDIGIGIETPASAGLNNGVGPQMPYAKDYSLNDYPGNIYKNGISRATQILQTGTKTHPIYWIEIAPMTNLGQILTDNSLLKSNMRIITMAGSIYKGYGHDHPAEEYNIKQNVSASELVYNYTNVTPYANNICAAPLDTTYYFQIYGNNYQRIYNSNLPIPKTMVENYKIWYDNGGRLFLAYRPFTPSTATSCMYDAEAMWMASIIAENSTSVMQADCIVMPFMQMQGSNIIVNNSAYTVNDTYNDNIQIVYEAIIWNGGEENGTYPLGQYIANILTQPRF